MELNGTTYRLFEPDNYCQLKDGSVIQIRNVVVTNNAKYVLGKKYLGLKDFYNQPCLSSALFIYLVNTKIYGEIEKCNIEQIYKKCLMLSYQEDNSIVSPLVHDK